VTTRWRVEVVLLGLLAAMFIASLAVWGQTPDQIPVHWNVHGAVDRYGGKAEGLLMLPTLALGIYLLMRFLPRIDPGRANYPRFGGTYLLLRAGIIVVMAAVHGLVIAWTLQHPIDVARAIPLLVGALCVTFGAVMGKVRPNWFVGIRTPWTISSKQAWIRTHRLGGWLFVLQGLLFIAAGLAKVAWFSNLVGGSVLTVVAVLFVYSYFVWRQDPEKFAPAGTSPADDDQAP
jgi:uncharacterized membrane protein